MYELVFLSGARAGQVVPIGHEAIAGRSSDCEIEVPDPNASRQHARLTFDGSAATVTDNGSSNGTWVNETRIAGTVRLRDGDVVRLGETRLRVVRRGDGAEGRTPTSVFGFHETDEDLSQSILLSITDLAHQAVQDPKVLAARLNAIIQISKAVIDIRGVEDLFARILQALFDVFPQADRGFLMLGDRVERLEAKAVHQRGTGGAEALAVSRTICRVALERKQAILFDDSKSTGFDQGQSIVSLRIRSAMVIPLMVGDQILGLLQIDTVDRERSFTQDDLELAVAACSQAAIAVRNAQLLKDIEHEATVRNNLMRYMPGTVVDQVRSGTLDLALGGRTCHGTVLFCDVRGFTRMSEAMDPEQVVRLMNGYFSRMVPCIQRSNGSVDKFMGDAVMAVWGIPLASPTAARSAGEAALLMQNALAGYNSLLIADNRPALAMGTGINSGRVVAGNIGADERKEYTVIGDTVNSAARLEHSAAGGQVLVSAATWQELGGKAYGIAMPPLRVRNRNEPVANLSLRGLSVEGGEILLHLPVLCGEHRGWIIRRLVDQSFLLLHESDLDVSAAPLLSDAPEWAGIELGRAIPEQVLPAQESDGRLVRSCVRLTDDTLCGLIGPAPLASGAGGQ